MVRKIHDGAGRYTQPILQRYPLLFSLLIFFGVAATLDGFRMMTEDMILFREHPAYLFSLGLLVLLLTGMLYGVLGKKQD